MKAIICCLILAGTVTPAAWSQAPQQQQQQGPSGFNWLSGLRDPYRYREVGPVNLSNSGRLDALLRSRTIYLSLQDAIALALENNLDIEIQRYGPRLAEADLLRAHSGGAIRGSSGAIQSSTTGGNQGALTGIAQAPTVGASGPIQSLDPVLTSTISWGHLTTPLTNTITAGTNSLVTTRKLANFGVSKGFLTGTSVNFGFNNTNNFQNSGRNDFNPYTNGSATLQIGQSLLQGFGIAVNNRNIRIAKNNIQVADLVFRQQVISTVSNIIGMYWDLVAYSEDVKVRQRALDLAQKLYDDNKKQVEIGTLAPIEIVRAEAEVARSQQDLLISQTNVRQQETILKNALSRTGMAHSEIAEARIIATDRVNMPEVETVEPIQDLVQRALDRRPELMQSRINIENSRIGLKGSRNALLPTLDAFANLSNNALAGQINALPVPPIPGAPAGTSLSRNPASVDKFFIGGYSTVLSQLFSRNFPDYTVGVQLNIPLRNRAAQADLTRDQLALRQQELRLQVLINQIRVDVQNALIALEQARARYRTATRNRILQEQYLDAEQKKNALGASTIFFVIQAQRDLAQAQASEVQALTAYSRAKTDLDRATGLTLEVNDIVIDEAKQGQVARPPSPLPVIP